MKLIIWILAALAGAGTFFGYRHLAEQRAEAALKHSLCEEELNEALMKMFPTSGVENDRQVAAAHVMGIGSVLRESSLAPHLPALSRMAEEESALLPRIHRLAGEVSTQCPEVFPDEISGRKMIAGAIMLGTARE